MSSNERERRADILSTMYRTLDWKDVYMEVWAEELLKSVEQKSDSAGKH